MGHWHGADGVYAATRKNVPHMTLPAQPPALSEGSRLAQYELKREVGRGGMGVVYLARDVDLEREVALKLLWQGGGSDPSAAAAGRGVSAEDARASDRFLIEARSAARISHPHVVTIYQVGIHQGLGFIAMEWMEGGSLAEHLKRNVFLDWREATGAIRDAAAGLAAAHQAGVIHRDIKPSNLMRTASGSVKLVDFGLARMHNVASDLTQSGIILGTPAYLSPEQCRGEPATALSDIYGLACTYFHLLTSRPPFESQSPMGMLYQHLNEPFPDPRRFADDVPDTVCQILMRAGRKKAGERYESAAAMLADLQAALDEQTSQAVALGSRVGVADHSALGNDGQYPLCKSPNNLPQSLTTFVGRRHELVEARQALADSRLLTLVGAGGTGKTRLALQLARDLLGLFPDGVWFVELSAIGSGQRIAQSIAAALGLRESPGTALIDTICQNLDGRWVLLVLDNCEHVVNDAAAIVSALLTACPNLRVLATSRQSLSCEGETMLRVPSLAMPESPRLPPLDILGKLDSVRLFVVRAAQARGGFKLTADNAADIAQICRRLDGIPLAIELAAARIKVLSVRQIAQRLDDAFGLLTSGARTSLPRQRTLRASIDWSYELLSPDERIVLARLGVFMGGFSLESAEAVAGGDGIDRAAVLDMLAELLDKSLLIMKEKSGLARYRMLETIRQYAAEKLEQATRQRHLEYFVQLAEQALAELFGPDQAQWLERLDLEQDNMLAALDFAGSSDLGLRLAAVLARYWYMRGQVIGGLDRLQKLIDADPPASVPLANVLCGAGRLAMWRGEPDHSRQFLDRSLTMAIDLGDERAQATCLNDLGTLAKETGNLPKALELFARVLELRRRQGDKGNLAGALNNLGIIRKQLGDAPAARQLLEESLAIQKELGNATWIAYSYLNLGELELEENNAAAARLHYQSSLDMLRDLQDEWGAAGAIEGLGKCDLADGKLDAARSHFEQTLAIVRRIGVKGIVADQLDNLAQIALRQGDSSSAWSLASQSMTVRAEIKDQVGLAESLETLAAARAADDPGRAARLLGAADTLHRQIQLPLPPARLTDHESLIARLRSALGDPAFEAAFSAGRSLLPGDPAILGPGQV